MNARQTDLTVGDITIHRIVEWETPVFRPVDFFPAASQDEIERLGPWFDHDLASSRDTRKTFLDSHCETETLVMTAHFPLPSVGQVLPHSERPFDFRYLQAEESG